MGFTGIDDFIDEISTNGKFLRSDFTKTYQGSAATAGRWYDFAQVGIGTGIPGEFIHGNMVSNYHFAGGPGNWTLGSANWAWTAATHVITRTASADGSTLSQNTSCVNGVSYSVVYTLTRTAGSVTVSLGGTAGTSRSSSATFRETIACGAGAGAPLTFTPDATFAGTIDVVGVTRDLGFTPYSDVLTPDIAMYHGGDVSPDTKHLVNIGCFTVAATGVPAVLMLVDMLGCYPRIATNDSSSQALNNTLTLPRYATGAGVRPFLSVGAVPGANARTITLSYTNAASVAGRGLAATVSAQASAIVGHIEHSGTGANSYGPFLPLQGGDTGVQSVQSLKYSAASASAGTVDLILCKPIATIPLISQYTASERDLMNQVPSLPRIEDGACLNFILFTGAAMSAANFTGFCDFAWG